MTFPVHHILLIYTLYTHKLYVAPSPIPLTAQRHNEIITLPPHAERASPVPAPLSTAAPVTGKILLLRQSNTRMALSRSSGEQLNRLPKPYNIIFKSPKMLTMGILHEIAGTLWHKPALSTPAVRKVSKILKTKMFTPKSCPHLRNVNKSKNPFHKDPICNSVSLIFVLHTLW